MHSVEHYLVFPDGEEQEIDFDPPFNQLLDCNGNPLRLPLASEKILAYRSYSVRRREDTGITQVFHRLELVPAVELKAFVR